MNKRDLIVAKTVKKGEKESERASEFSRGCQFISGVNSSVNPGKRKWPMQERNSARKKCGMHKLRSGEIQTSKAKKRRLRVQW